MRLIGILVLMILAGIVTYGFFVWRTVNASIEASKPLIKKAVAYEQHPANANIKILIAGDSTGVGVGASTNRDSIAGRIGREYPSADITNISHSGDRLSDLEDKLNSHKANGYDLVLLQVGANDITGRTPLSEVRDSLRVVLDQAGGIGKKVIVMTSGDVGLSPAFLWPLSQFFDHSTREVRAIFMSEASQAPHTTYVDLFNERKDEVFNSDIPRYYAADHFHPSEEGYGEWYQKLQPVLEHDLK